MATVTALLADPSSDPRGVLDRLLPLVYDELRRMARGQTTALVHEAYLKLVDESTVPLRNRRYFYGAAARAMRQVMVDAARRRNRLKRGDGQRPLPLDEAGIEIDAYAAELIHVDEALTRLARAWLHRDLLRA